MNAGGVLRFTVTNNRPADSERLLGVTTAAAQKSRVVGNVEIAPQSAVSFGEPNYGGDSNSAVFLDALDPGLVPATSADVTFRFERAGDITVPVPVEACPTRVP